MLAKKHTQHSKHKMSIVMITAIFLIAIKIVVAVIMGQVYERKPVNESTILIRPTDISGKLYP